MYYLKTRNLGHNDDCLETTTVYNSKAGKFTLEKEGKRMFFASSDELKAFLLYVHYDGGLNPDVGLFVQKGKDMRDNATLIRGGRTEYVTYKSRFERRFDEYIKILISEE